MVDIGEKDVVYISAPMTGLPNFGRGRMRFVADLIRERFPNVKVVNPADNSPKWSWEQNMEYDMRVLREEATIMVLLSGWEKSRGARMEVGLAIERNLPIVSFEELLQSCLPAMHLTEVDHG